MNKQNLEYLYGKTIDRIFESPANYISFLDCATPLYKYSYIDQILLFAQIPAPTAVATFAQWKTLGRSINRGAVAAIRFNSDSKKGITADLFDIKDTNGAETTLPRLWALPDDSQLSDLIGTLPKRESSYKELEELIAQSSAPIFSSLPPSVFDRVSIAQALITASIGYSACVRLNLPTAQYQNTIDTLFDKFAFHDVNRHIKIDIGQMISLVSKEILLKTERGIKYEYQQSKQKSDTAIATHHQQERNDASLEPGHRDLSPAHGTRTSRDVRDDAGRDFGTAAPQQISTLDGGHEPNSHLEGSQRTMLPDARMDGIQPQGTTAGARELLRESTVADDDFHGSRGIRQDGADSNSKFASELGISQSEYELVKESIIAWDGFASTQNSIASFFMEETDTDKRLLFMADAYGTAHNAWGFSSRLTKLDTNPKGMNISLAKTEDSATFEISLTWEQVEPIISQFIEEDAYPAQENNKEKSISAAPRKLPFSRTEPVVLMQTSLDGFVEEDANYDNYLREALSQEIPHQNADKVIRDIMVQIGSVDKKIKALKETYSYFGHSFTFSDNVRGLVHYDSKGAFINIRATSGNKEQKVQFSWKKVTELIQELIENGQYHVSNIDPIIPETAVTDDGELTLNVDPNAPTLKTLLAKPDTVTVVVIDNLGIRTAQVEQTESGVADLLECEKLAGIPFGHSPSAYVYQDANWLDKNYGATIWGTEVKILFGSVVIAKLDGELPVEPEPVELELWKTYYDKAHTFTNSDIMKAIAVQLDISQQDSLSDRELFGLADRINPSNRIRILLIEPDLPPTERYIEDTEESFQHYVGSDLEYIELDLDGGVDALVSSKQDGAYNRDLNGTPVFGTFIITQCDDVGLTVDLEELYLDRYSKLLDVPILNVIEEKEFELPEEYDVPTPLTKDQFEKETLDNMTEESPPKPIGYKYSHDGEFSTAPKLRFQKNIDAIQMLGTIEIEKRTATPQEQEVLSLYAGWGGLSEAFDSTKVDWSEEYGQLKDLLGEVEYNSARASTLSSFYTPLSAIHFIYSAVEKFGFHGGTILEPAVGTGRFFGAMPDNLVDHSKLYGVELDSLSARISTALYPNATIYQSGYEATEFSNNQFDIAVGNVPFGNYKIADPTYNKHNFLIHDYFFAKTIDKVRTGGVIALITSTGTMDRKTSDVREYMAQRCDLIGAVRLPDNTFSTTGTKTSSDILFLQKRELLREIKNDRPNWVDADIIHTYEYDDGKEVQEQNITQNRYFIENPHMVLGSIEIVTTPFGKGITCKASPGVSLAEKFPKTLTYLRAEIPAYEFEDEILDAIPAPPEVKNFTFANVGGNIYYREHGLLLPQKLNKVAVKRMEGMLDIRYTLNTIIALQPTVGSEDTLSKCRKQLNSSYDSFVEKYDVLNSPTNSRLFAKDIQCNLLLALEGKGEDGDYQKTDIFHKRTVDPRRANVEVNSAADALYVSLNKSGYINLFDMEKMYGKSCEDIVVELGDMIYQNPVIWEENPYIGWETREEYLSGNIRTKLEKAKELEEQHPAVFEKNILALEENLPEWIEAGQIEVRLGASWVGKEYFTRFMYETFNTPSWLQGENNNRSIRIAYNMITTSWTIYNGTTDSSVLAKEVYGTKRVSAYSLLEDCLNLRDTKVMDQVDKNKYVLNQVDTELARAKQTQIKNAFRNWIFNDVARRTELVGTYNRLFNSVRVRIFDGSHLKLPNLSTDFKPYEHQRNAVAHILNTSCHSLLDHEVGAGKTATMIIGAYDRIRMGSSKRAMFVVLNHMTKDFGKEINRLYPDAKIMIVTEKDFEKANRQKFLNRIAFSDVDMIVIAHSQFEKIQMSPYHREEILRKEIGEMTFSINQMKEDGGLRLSVKQIERTRKEMETRLKALHNEGSKDQGNVSFEQMGIDMLLVDEADLFKNCYIFTKLQNVAGIGTSASQRAADMLMKCRYLTNSGGKLVFATGTVISNALSEMYVMQRYLQEGMLHEQGIYHFDQWVANFAETVTSLEMAPEGNGFRQRTRLSKYFNIPELMQLYRMVADVQTEETLNLPTPQIAGGEPSIILCPPSENLLAWVRHGVQRCDDIRNRRVEPSEDNMLKFTLEAKLAGMDMRLLDPDATFDPNGKIAECSKEVLKFYTETMDERGVQIAFSDISTPNAHKFNVYDELKFRCIELGIPSEEIAFIHEAKTDKAKSDLFAKCRTGEIRLLLGSTSKCGAGTNIQDRLIASHHIDCPYRPRDLKQRDGRIKRQGNMFPFVHINRYITERSFDAYLWNIIATKQRFISQIRQGSLGQRTFEDKDETLLGFEAAQAIASGDPRIMEKINLDNEISKLQLLQADYNNQRYRLQDRLSIQYPTQLQEVTKHIDGIESDMVTISKNLTDKFHIILNGKAFDNREEAGNEIITIIKLLDGTGAIQIGTYKGLSVELSGNFYASNNIIALIGARRYEAVVNKDTGVGTATRLDNLSKSLEDLLLSGQQRLSAIQSSIISAKEELEKPFELEQQLTDAIERQGQLNIELNLDKPQEAIAVEETNAVVPPEEPVQEKTRVSMSEIAMDYEDELEI